LEGCHYHVCSENSPFKIDYSEKVLSYWDWGDVHRFIKRKKKRRFLPFRISSNFKSSKSRELNAYIQSNKTTNLIFSEWVYSELIQQSFNSKIHNQLQEMTHTQFKTRKVENETKEPKETQKEKPTQMATFGCDVKGVHIRVGPDLEHLQVTQTKQEAEHLTVTNLSSHIQQSFSRIVLHRHHLRNHPF